MCNFRIICGGSARISISVTTPDDEVSRTQTNFLNDNITLCIAHNEIVKDFFFTAVLSDLAEQLPTASGLGLSGLTPILTIQP